MKNLHSPKTADRTVPVTLALSFAMPFTVILILFAVSGIAPFGDYSLCSMDGFSQYYPMLMNMTEAVKKGELFYSFNGGLGFNLWAQSAYYTNSLFWLPLYFLPHSLQVSYIDLSVLLRLSLAGLFFCIRLVSLNKNTSYKRMLTVYPVMSLVWALSGFMSAFINQFMWLDVVVFLPLVILGIEKIKDKKSPALYISVLFLSIASCFYLSFMVCIFAVLWFMFIMLREKHSFKEFLSRATAFFSSSLLSGGMSAAVILPVYKALALTKASELGFDGTLKINYTLKEFFLRLLPFQETSHAYKLPNIYCTATVIILFFFFLFSKKFTLRHRIAALIFVTFMYLSMSINLGEFIWHGFHYPNQLPARQSFLVIFLMVSLAAEFLRVCKFDKQLFYLTVALIATASVMNFSVQFYRDVWKSRVNSLQRYETVMEKFTAPDDEDTFARMEWNETKKNNYPLQYSYKGISYYSSTMQGSAYDFFQSIGMERYAKNVSVRYIGSDILNAVFSVKYVMSGINGETVEENENALSLAFLSSSDILTCDLTADTGEEAQQLLWDSLCGKKDTDFTEGFTLLSENQMKVTSFTPDFIEGSLKADRDGVLFTSIPYDEGWEIYIDGEKRKTEKGADFFLCCGITEGEHQITMKYTVPGIKTGALISLASLICFSAVILFRRKRRAES